MKRNDNLYKLVLTAVLSALIVAMTVVPMTGYISYGGILEITTLHIVVIIGAVFLGWKYGGILGFVWGASCVVRALVMSGNPAFLPFVNPMVSLVPRVVVGLVAGGVADLLFKVVRKPVIVTGIAAAMATLTNTLLVLSMYYIFGGMIDSISAVFELFKTIILTIISLNGGIELVAAVVIVPFAYKALSHAFRKKIKKSEN